LHVLLCLAVRTFGIQSSSFYDFKAIQSTLENLFLHTFSETIWRILPHPSPQVNEWLLELRNVNEKTTSFALIDTDLLEVRWLVRPKATDWWTTLTAFSGDLVFLHNYRNPEIPEPSDLVVLAAGTGELSWVLPNRVFVKNVDEKRIEVAHRLPDGIKKIVYNIQAEPFEDPIASGKSNFEEAEILTAPSRYTNGDQYYSSISSFLFKIAGVKDIQAVDYLECEPFLVLSYYIYEHDQIAQYLIIVNRERKILRHECIAKALKGVGMDTFLLKGKVLVYLRNSNEFISLKLTPYNEISD
jgi:hypothetical protein